MSYRLLKAFFLFSFMFVSQVTNAAKIPDDITSAEHFGTNTAQVIPEDKLVVYKKLLSPKQTKSNKFYAWWLRGGDFKFSERTTFKLNSGGRIAGGACVLYFCFLLWDIHYSHKHGYESFASYSANNPIGGFALNPMEEQRLRNEVRDLKRAMAHLTHSSYYQKNDSYIDMPLMFNPLEEGRLRSDVKYLKREVTKLTGHCPYKDNDSSIPIIPLSFNIQEQQKMRNEIRYLRQEVTNLGF
jgi:hypothetical protein